MITIYFIIKRISLFMTKKTVVFSQVKCRQFNQIERYPAFKGCSNQNRSFFGRSTDLDTTGQRLNKVICLDPTFGATW